MPLFSVKTSKKVEANIKLEESTARMLDRYAHFHKGPADEVVNEALEYIFTKDKDFQQWLRSEPNIEVPNSLRLKKVSPSIVAAKSASKSGAVSNGAAANK